MKLKILYIDAHLVAINKPHGLLVHRSSIAKDANVFALQLLRDQLDKHVYPVHRLDRKTGGVLLFALNEEILKEMQKMFGRQEVNKTYLAIVRGHTPDFESIDYPLVNDSGKEQQAVTSYKTLKLTELNVAFGKFKTSRYSLVMVNPKTGRMHQIRKHFAHIRHPIIGDRPHGCNKQNKLFHEKWNMMTMLLHAQRLEFVHPNTGKTIKIEAPLHNEFARIKKIMGL